MIRILGLVCLFSVGVSPVFAQSAYVGQVRHAPSINGSVQGSLQQMLGESVTFNGGANVTGDLYVIGTPTVQMNGTPTYGGTLQGSGATSPSNYTITLNTGAALGHVVRRTNAVTWPSVASVPTPTNTASVTVTTSSQSVNWGTARDVTLNSGVGQFTVPAGTYGTFTANNNSGFTLGVAGATTAAVYNFQNLNLNSISKLLVVGPVIVNVANGFSANSTVGASTNPVWLALNIKSGGLTLNSGCNVYGYVLAPSGTVIINNSTQLVGGVTADYLTVNGGGLLKLQAPNSANQPPTVTLTAPANGSSYVSPASITLSATAGDADGTVAKVEFYRGTTKVGEDTTAPYSIVLTGITAGSYSYFARAIDNAGATTDSATSTVTVTNPNQPPTITLTAPADGATFFAPVSVTVAATASDPDGTIARVDFFVGTTLISSDTTAPYQVSTSTLSAGTYALSAKAIDNSGATTTSATATITVLNPNQAPTVAITAPADGTSYDDPASFTVTATATDSDGTVVKVGFYRNGVLQGEDTTAPYSYAAAGLAPGIYDFVARATDNQGSATDSAPVRVTVAHVNDAPVANAQSVSTNEDTSRPITLTATDPDGDALTYTVLTQPSSGSLSGTAPNLAYTPAPDASGTVTFTFRASDGALQSAPATVTITVVPVNDPPTATPKSLVVARNGSGSVHLSGTDIDSPSLQFAVSSGPAHGILSGNLPDLVYTPTHNYSGPDAFSYTAFDGEFISPAAQVTITVTPGNVAPTAQAGSATTDEDVPVAIVLSGSDADGDPLTYGIASSPTHGALSGTAPNLSYTPAANYHGPDAFSFTVSDAEFTSAAATVALTVRPVNDLPVAQPQSVSTVEDTALPLVLVATDNDVEDTLTYSIVMSPAHGTLSGTAPHVTYTPSANYHGPDGFTFKANDGTTDSSPGTIAIEVTPFNDRPVSGDLALTLAEDTPAAFDLPASDVDGDSLTYAVVIVPTHGTLSGTAPHLIYTPDANYHGHDEFSYQVSDGSLDSIPGLVTLEITPVNDAPAGASFTVSLDEDTSAGFALTGSDVDGDTVAFAIVDGPQHGGLSGTAPSLVYTPSANFNGTDTLTYTVGDGTIVSATYTVTFVVAPVNDAPVADPKSLATDEDIPANVTLAGSDVDGDSLTFAIVTPPAHGALSLVAPGIYTYTPAPNYNGTDSFTYGANDASTTSAPALVSIAIAPVNDAPVAASQSAVTPEDTAVIITLAGSDVDGDALSYAISAYPTHGTLTQVTSTTYSYLPAPDYHGPDAFQFVANDHDLTSAPAVVTLDVTPVNDAPVAVGQALTTDEDVVLPVTLGATDVDGDALVFTVQASPAHGTLSGNAPNLTYTPAADYHGPDAFTFTASDGSLTSATATVTLTVNSINDAPVATGQSVTTAEDTAKVITLAASDVDGDALTYVITSLPTHGTLAGSGATRTYTPAPDYHGADSFTFMASDGSLVSADATVLVTVTPVNDAPVAQAATYAITTATPLALVLTGTDVDGDALNYTVVSRPTHGTLTGTPPDLTYTSAPDFGGFDSLTFKVNDGTVDSAIATVQFTTGLPPRSRTYTTTTDFSGGNLVSMNTDTPDQLSNKHVLTSFDAVWIANSSKGTVIKIDPETARVIGEYNAKPVDAAAPYPSRIAVDSKGNAWVANMSHNSIIKIGLPENGFWVDRNGNGQIDTSSALGDIKNWNADDIDSADDEAILLYVRTAVNGVRHISVDAEDNVWVGGPTGDWQKFDGRTGALLRTETSIGKGGMGGFIAGNGKLYSAGTDFLVWQTADPMAALPQGDEIRQATWASALDSQGNLWVTKDWTSTVVKYAPDGTKLGEYYHGEPWAMGIAIDANDNIWVAHSHCGHSVGHLLPDGTLLGNVEVANHGPVEVSIDRRGRIWVASSTGVVQRINPLGGTRFSDDVYLGEVELTTGNLGGALWTYGRFTGSGFGLSSPDGLWTFVYDGVLSGSTWGPVSWNALLTNDGKVLVEAALSSDGVTYGAFQPLTYGHSTPTGAGRYLKVRSRLVSAKTGESPVLYDLSVGTEGYTPPPVPSYWSVTAGEDIKGNWPDKVQLKGAFQHTVHDFSVEPVYLWTQESGPGPATFDHNDVLRPTLQFPAKGDYVFRLTATLGAEVSTATVKVSLTPYNRAPYANAGYTTFRADVPPQIWLLGEVRDDGLPLGAPVTSHWEKLFGPGSVTFSDPASPATNASFSAPGVYVLRLSASDTELTGSDVTTVWLGYSCIPVAPPGLVSWWQASANGDDHVGGNQAFTERGTDYAEGKIGGAFRFDGVNDRVRVFSAPSLDAGLGDGFSVELWANPDTSRTATLFEYASNTQRGFSIRQLGSRVEADFREVNGTSHVLGVDGVLPVSTWTHLAATYDKASGEARIYINGILRNSQIIGSFVLRTNLDVNFGGQTAAAESYDGLLDEVSVYNRALYSDEVATIVGHPAGKRPPVANVPPTVDVGPGIFGATANTPVALNATVTDDGQPIDGVLTSHWSKLSGPGVVSFGNEASPQTTATFSEGGVYVLKLLADDGGFCTEGLLEVRVGALYKYDTGLEVSSWWTGNDTDLDVVHGLKMERFNGLGYGAGEASNGFVFDGNDDFGKVAASPFTNIGASATGLTIEMWVKPAENRYGYLLDWGTTGSIDGVALAQWDGGPNLLARLWDTNGGGHDFITGGVFTPNTWVHIAMTYNRVTGIGRLYKNGVLALEQNMGVFLPQTSKTLFFGQHRDGHTRFKGVIDEATFYSRPLTLAEIQAIYEGDVTGKVNLDNNLPPAINAGPDQYDVVPDTAVPLMGTVTDDGRPAGGTLNISWSKLEGPGTVTFANANAAATTATFSAAGTYVLQLSANDGLNQGAPDTMVVRVGVTASVEPDATLAAWWPANGDVHEVVHGNHDVEFLPRGPGFAAGEVGEGFAFNGSDEFGRVPASSELDIGASAAGLTVEMWVKPTENRYGYLVHWGTTGSTEGVALAQWDGGPNLLARLWDTNGGGHDFITGGVFTPNTWVHIAMTYNRVTGIGRLYKNGVLAVEQNMGVFQPQTSKTLFFGQHRDGHTRFKGVIDEISIYNKPLALADIQAIYNAGSNGKSPLDDNLPPVVNAGPDVIEPTATATIPLNGTVTDDGRPAGHPLTIAWSKLEGPGTVNFADATAAATTATFSAPGTYVLQLDARDALHAATPDTMVVRVGVTASVEPDATLAAWWPANGDIHEIVHGNHDVEFLPRGPGFATGEVGEGFAFNGSDEFGRVPASSELDIGASPAGLTVEMWVKPTENRYGYLLHWGTTGSTEGVALAQWDGGPNLLGRLWDTNGGGHDFLAGGIFTPNTWVHVAMTYDRVTGIGRLYKNGVLALEQNMGIFQPQTSKTLFFGQHRDGHTRFKGVIDEVSIYTKPLSLADIQAIYNAGLSGKSALDDNLPPVVNAGPDVTEPNATATISLNGTVIDDGKPVGHALAIAWNKLEGPGTVSFDDATAAATTATFSAPGTYVLRLSAADGLNQGVPDTMVVRVGVTTSVEPDGTLAAWWPANGEIHEVVHGNHDVEFLPRGPGFAPGEVGEGFAFNGSDEFGRTAASSDLDIGASPAGLTVEMWVKPTENRYGYLLHWGTTGSTEGVALAQWDGGPNLLGRLWDTNGGGHDFLAGGIFTPNTWVHVAMTYDRVTGIGRLYKNGVLALEQNLGIFQPQTSKTLFFGEHRDGHTRFKGVIDEVGLYTKPLTLADIQAIYNAGLAGKSPLDDNLPPVVNAGPDVLEPMATATVALNGTVTDDGHPLGYALTLAWSKLEGPGTVNFVDATAATTSATFSAPGTYVLQLDARDALQVAAPDRMVVRVGVTGGVAPDATLAAWWPANGEIHEVVHGNHDVEFLPRGPRFVTGEVGQGFNFNGDDEFGRVPASSELDVGASPAGLTVEMWVKPAENRYGYLLHWGTRGSIDGVALAQWDGGPNLLGRLWDTNGGGHDFLAGGVFTPNTWVHVAMTYDRTTGIGRLYKNGALALEQNLGIFQPQTSKTLYFAQHRDDHTRFKGTIDEVSIYTKPLAPADIQAIYNAGLAGKSPLPQNLAPTVLLDSPVSASSVVVNTPVTLGAIAADADGTVAKVEFYDGVTKIAETTTADAGQPTRFSYVLPSGLSLGQHVLSARAIDNLGAVTPSSAVTIFVVPVLPVVAMTTPTAGAVLVTGIPLGISATATYSLGAVAKVEFFDGPAKLGEATAPSSVDTFTFTVPAGLSAGAHTLTAKATAGGFTATSAPINVTSHIVVPVVSLTSPANGSTIVAAVPVALKATATTAQGTITKVEFFEGATKLGERTAPDTTGGSSYTFTVAGGFSAGAHSLTAKATSSTATTATSIPVGITAGAYTGVPVVALSTPAEDTRVSAPTMVTGVVAVPSLTGWILDYRLKVADGDPTEPWVEFASGSNLAGTPGSSPATDIPGPLGTFDPTLLLNGIYEVRLRATDASATTYTAGPITLIVDGNMKVGAFTLAFEDLKVPVAGVPITITRTYDSRDARVGDFGPGWNIAVANIRVQKNRNLGANWYQTDNTGVNSAFLSYFVSPYGDRVVTVTMPDGETHRFRGGAYVRNTNTHNPADNESIDVIAHHGKFRFYPLGDTTSTLEPLDNASQLADDFYIAGTGDNDLTSDDPLPGEPGTVFNPTRFRLTTKDGTRYIVDEKLGLLRLEDLNGNTLVLNRDGANKVTAIVSTQAAPSGPVVSTVTIHRDVTGRVDYIRDPAGRDLDYLYDAQGRLSSFINRELNVTQFFYENPAFPHHLTKIVDPRGVSALRSEFDADGRLIKQIDADGKETVFDRGVTVTGRFEKVTDRLGQATTYFYDERGNVTTKIDALGAQTTYSYYPDTDRVKLETNHYGTVKATAYDARGNVTVETMGANASDDPASPTSGFVVRTTYNDFSSPVQMTDPDGRVQVFAYDPVTNEPLSHTIGFGGAAPSTTTYHHNADGTIDSSTDALGNITSYAYDYSFTDSAYPGAVKQIIVTIRDSANAVLRVTRSVYDLQENMLAQIVTRTLPGAGTEEVVTRYFYDAENRLTATIMPDGKVGETRYTSFGQTDRFLLWKSLADYQSANTALARVTSYGYDARGNQTSVTQPDGSYEVKSYDLENRVEWSEDANRNRTWFVYDPAGRLTHTYLPDSTPAIATDGPRTEIIYDLIGRVRYEMDEVGSLVEYTYDNDCGCAMRKKSMIRYLQTGNEITFFDYDKAGNQTLVTDPRGNTKLTDYDDHSRATTVHYPATDEHPATTTQTGYDLRGRRVSVTDQEGKVTRNRYDGLGRLVEVRQYLDQSLAASDANFGLPPATSGIVSTHYSYDELDNQLTQVDARGNTTSYQYDSMGRQTKRILPDAAFETMQYDDWGNLWKRTDFKGYTTTFLYDPLNRLIEKKADPTHPSLIYSHAPDTISYGYDAAGKRVDALVEKGSTVLYAEDTPVDERGRRQFKNTPLGKLTYDYQANSLLKGITSSNAEGVKLGYRYDEANRLAYVDDGSFGATKTTSYGYNASGSLTTVTTPNTIVHTYSYDALNRLRTLNVSRGATTLHGYEYKLQASGHRRQVVEGGKTTTYIYDDLYRLTNETVTGDSHGNSGSVSYGLDKVGNRLFRNSSVPPVSSASSTFNSRDWLASDTYDANGNSLTTSVDFGVGIPSAPDVYDFEDRLIIRRKADGSTVHLSYDADGLLRQKAVYNTSMGLISATGYLTDSQNPTGYAQIMEERINTAAGTTVKTYAYGNDLISQSTLAPGSTLPVLRYFSYDGLGSVRELTSESGTVTDTYDYDAFGLMVYASSGTANLSTSYLYRGERFDSDLGQYYLRARLYNQATGRFWNADTFEGNEEDPASLHRYLYAGADPENGFDPSGLMTLADIMSALGVDDLMEASRTIVANRGKNKAIKTLGCVAGAEGIKSWLDMELSTENHHAIPNAMWPNKNTIPLPVNTHRMFHRVLDILIRGSGNKAFKDMTGSSSAAEWAGKLALKAEKKAMIQLIKAASRYVDKQCSLKGPLSILKFVEAHENEWLGLRPKKGRK